MVGSSASRSGTMRNMTSLAYMNGASSSTIATLTSSSRTWSSGTSSSLASIGPPGAGLTAGALAVGLLALVLQLLEDGLADRAAGVEDVESDLELAVLLDSGEVLDVVVVRV